MRKMKKLTSVILSLIMVIAMMPSFAFAKSGAANVITKTMELPEKVFSEKWNNQYDIVYHEKGTEYTYKGEKVTFVDDNHIKIKDNIYDVKSKEVTVDVSKNDNDYTIKIKEIPYAVGSIPGKWNSTYAGKMGVVYVDCEDLGTDGVVEGNWTFESKTFTINLKDVKSGIHILKDGAVLEAPNEWSPGYDFGDGKGTVKDRLFGVLPDITIDNGSLIPDKTPSLQDLKDGIYEGVGQGKNGEIKVEVYVKEHKITAVKEVSHQETPGYWSLVQSLFRTIVEKQSTNVDAVTGATFSSNGIKEAVKHALSKEAVKPLPVEVDSYYAITDKDLNNNQYNPFYYDKSKTYTYNGEKVVFKDGNTITAGDKDYNLINKPTGITVDTSKNDKVVITLDNIIAPVGSIPGKWNSGYKGIWKAVYTQGDGFDKSGQIESANCYSNGKNAIITFDNLKPGTYVLDKGTIFEQANEFSMGHDFGDGKGTVTEGYFGTLPVIKFTVERKDDGKYLGVDPGADLQDSFTNDVWTQYDFKELKVGDTATLTPRRVPEAITNPIGNNVQLPHFNYKIISGDSVTIDDSNNAHADIKAVKTGNTVIQVTYDDLEHFAGTHFAASDAVNTAYVIYSVGGNDSIKIEDNIDSALSLKGKDAKVPEGYTSITSYDTIYFTNGNTTSFDLKVNATGSDKLVVKCNGLVVGESKDKGHYILPLENRSNIIEMTATAADGTSRSLFRVIDARKIKINISNVTNPDKPLRVGDKAKISFVGVTMPVYKLATIYNPQFGSNSTSINYDFDGKTYKGHCGQWDLDKRNSFTVDLTKTGEYNFTDAKIECNWWGKPLGADKTQDSKDDDPFFGAPVVSGYFSTLPDFSFNVEKSINIESITLDKENIEMTLGEDTTLNATLTPADTTIKNVNWTTSDEKVATVDKTGKVTTVGVGEATITAESCGKIATCKVVVKEPVLKSITLDKQELSIYEGENSKLTVKYNPENVIESSKNVAWKSNNEQVVTVDEKGNVKAIKPGQAEITVISAINPEFNDKCKVTVKELEIEKIAFENTEASIKKGESIDLGYSVEPASLKDKVKLVWSSSDKTVATVNSQGRVVGIKAGQAVIKGEYRGLSATCQVTVEDAQSLNITPEINPEKIFNGSQVTVNLKGLDKPEEVQGKNIWNEYLTFKTTIPGLKEIKSADFGVLSFTVPSNTPSGTYYLADGYYYADFGGVRVQGLFIIGNQQKVFYKGEIAPIAIEIINKEEEAAKLQTAKDNAIAELNGYKDLNDYRDAGQKEIKKILSDSTTKIDAVTNIEDIDRIVNAAKSALDKVKTDAQFTDEENQVESDKVIGLIHKINEVTLDSKNDIDAARAAYDKLNTEAQKKVTNYDKLVGAEKKYAELISEVEKPENPQQSVDNNKPENPQQGGDNNNSNNANENKDPSLIHTGDEASILIYGLLLFGALGSIVVLRKKRNYN